MNLAPGNRLDLGISLFIPLVCIETATVVGRHPEKTRVTQGYSFRSVIFIVSNMLCDCLRLKIIT